MTLGKKAKFLNASLLVVALGTVLHAAPTIPPTCSTPGSCPDLAPALKNVTVQQDVKFADTTGAKTVSIKAPTTLTNNVTITLPPTNGQTNQILVVNSSGNLDWADYNPDRFLGTVSFMQPDPTHGIYLLNGQTVTDAKLAAYITAHPISGFSVSGNDVTLPDLRGRFIGASDGFGIPATAGNTGNDKTAVNGLGMRITVVNNETNANTGHLVYQGDGGQQTYDSRFPAGSYSMSMVGDTETMPNWVGMPLCIIGGSK